MKTTPRQFRAAAELVATGEFGCCRAITHAAYDQSCVRSRDFFRGLFYNRWIHEYHGYWWGSPFYREADDRNARVIALLLAALIYEDEHKVK